MQRPLHSVLLAGLAGLSLMCTACGEGDRGAEPPGATASDAQEAAPASADCSAFPEDLVTKYGVQKQLILNLAMARGRNLKSMRETTGAPEPDTFRRLQGAFESYDWEGIEPAANFDTPEEVARDLGKTADLLENALAAGDNTADPAWAELSGFYTQKFFIRHNSAVSYYLREAGCV